MNERMSAEKRCTIDAIIEHRLGIPGPDFFDTLTSSQLEEFDALDLEPPRSALWDELKCLPLKRLREVLVRETAVLAADAAKVLRPLDQGEAQRWVDHDVWLVPEAVALSFGVAPTMSGSHDELHAWASKNYRLHPQAKEVIGRYKVVGVALQAGTFADPIEPQVFLSWLARKSFASAETLKLFQAYGGYTYEELNVLLTQEKDRNDKLENALLKQQEEMDAKPSRSGPVLLEIIASIIDICDRTSPNKINKTGNSDIISQYHQLGYPKTDRQLRRHLNAARKVLDKGRKQINDPDK